MKKVFIGAIYSIIVSFILVGSVKAIEIILTPQELKELTSQADDVVGFSPPATQPFILETPSSTIQAATTTRYLGDVTPNVNNTYNLGAYEYAWKDVYASGTIFVDTLDAGSITIDQIINEPLLVGNGSASATINGSSTSTFPYGLNLATLGGNVGIGTSTPHAPFSVQNNAYFGNQLTVGGNFLINAALYIQDINNTGWIFYGEDSGGTPRFTVTDAGSMAMSNTLQFNGSTPLIKTSSNIDLTINPDGSGNVLLVTGASAGNVGIGTNIPSNLLTLYKNTNSALLAVGNGSATTTIAGGVAGSTTSTFAGDVSIQHAFLGSSQFPLDNGINSAWNLPISSSASTGSLQAIGGEIDGRAFWRTQGTADALGNVYNLQWLLHNEQGTATTSIRQPRNNVTSTPLIDIKETAGAGDGSCLVLTDAVTGNKVYASIENASWVLSTTSCLADDLPI